MHRAEHLLSLGMRERLYLAPGQLLDYCDSSGCLPGQV
jgi:hypothetical protein